MVSAEEELDEDGIQPTDVELHVLDRTKGSAPGMWVPAGHNVGESHPTRLPGESGFVRNGDGTVDFWVVDDAGGSFAVGAKAVQHDEQDDELPRVVPPVCGLGVLPATMATFAGLLLTPRRRRTWRPIDTQEIHQLRMR